MPVREEKCGRGWITHFVHHFQVHDQQIPDLRIRLLQHKCEALLGDARTPVHGPNQVAGMQQLLCARSHLCGHSDIRRAAYHVEENILPLRFCMVVEKLDTDSFLAFALVARGRYAKRAVCARAFYRLAQAALEAGGERVRCRPISLKLRVEDVEAAENEEGLLAFFAC